MRLLLVGFLLLCSATTVVGNSTANEEQAEVHKLTRMTKIVNEKKKAFFSSMANTKKNIKEYVEAQYARLQTEEIALRALEVELRDEVILVVKKRRLNMKDIESGALEIKRRRNLMKKKNGANFFSDVMIDQKHANNFLRPRNRKLWGEVGNFVTETASSVVDTVSDAASAAVDAVSDFASSLVGAAAEAFKWLGKIEEIISSSLSGLWDFVKGIFNNVRQLFIFHSKKIFTPDYIIDFSSHFPLFSVSVFLFLSPLPTH
jgi:hypothetical protein